MQLRRFEGKDLKKVMLDIKRELGDDAIIISTKRENGHFEVFAANETENFSDFLNTSRKENFSSFEIMKELSVIKSLLFEIVREKDYFEDENAFFLYRYLLDEGFSKDEASKLVSGKDLSKFLLYLCQRIKIEKSEKDVKVFFGPTGSGKTTTVAKLGMNLKKMGKKVTFVTTDNYRIGAREQIKRYGEILEIKTFFANTKEEILDILQNESGEILLDTEGLNPKDTLSIARMKGLFSNFREKACFYLVLPATDLRFERFLELCPDSLILTKLDELTDGLQFFKRLWNLPIPLSYISFGQKVPNDIIRAKRDKLLHLFLRFFGG